MLERPNIDLNYVENTTTVSVFYRENVQYYTYYTTKSSRTLLVLNYLLIEAQNTLKENECSVDIWQMMVTM